jgi:hypothetical protein
MVVDTFKAYPSQSLRLGLFALRSRFISLSLAFDAVQREFGAVGIVYAYCDAVRVPEVELSQAAVKVLLAAMLLDAYHAALEDAVIALDGIGADGHASSAVNVGVLLPRVIHNIVLGELASKALVAPRFVSHEMTFPRDVLANDGGDFFFGCGCDVEGPSRAASFHEGQDSVLVVRPPSLDLNAHLAANESFIDLHNTASAAHRREIARAHSLSDTVSEEPSGLHAARKKSLNLASRDALLAGAHQVDDLQPQMQRKVRTLEDCPLSNGELALALIAVVKAKASGFAFHPAEALRVSVAAVRAHWAMWPKLALDVSESGGFIIEARIVKSRFGHGGISCGFKPSLRSLLCQV